MKEAYSICHKWNKDTIVFINKNKKNHLSPCHFHLELCEKFIPTRRVCWGNHVFLSLWLYRLADGKLSAASLYRRRCNFSKKNKSEIPSHTKLLTAQRRQRHKELSDVRWLKDASDYIGAEYFLQLRTQSNLHHSVKSRHGSLSEHDIDLSTL